MGVVKILMEKKSSFNSIELLEKLDLRMQKRIVEAMLLILKNWKDQIKLFKFVKKMENASFLT